jgi:hypothetical protein
MAATVTPEQFNRTAEQRWAALQNANRIRLLRAQLKRDVKAGRASAADYLLDPPEFVLGMEVYDLLIAVPHKGRVKVTKALGRCRISPHRQVGRLTVAECARIAEAIR